MNGNWGIQVRAHVQIRQAASDFSRVFAVRRELQIFEKVLVGARGSTSGGFEDAEQVMRVGILRVGAKQMVQGRH